MLICLVKSMLNRWDSMPVVLDVRAKGRLIRVGIGEGSRQERYAAPQGVLPQCGMQHGAQEAAAEEQRGVAARLRHGCQWGAEREVTGRKPPGLILVFTSWNLSFRNSLCVKSSCVCWCVFSTATKYPGAQLKGALSVLTHNSQQRKVNKCRGGVESGHLKGYLHQRRVSRDRHPPARPHLLIYILYQFRNPLWRLKPCGPLTFSNPLTGHPTFTTRAFGVHVIPNHNTVSSSRVFFL